MVVVLAALASLIATTPALAQGTAFTYQGQLQNNGSPASGIYNLTFALFNTNTTGVRRRRAGDQQCRRRHRRPVHRAD